MNNVTILDTQPSLENNGSTPAEMVLISLVVPGTSLFMSMVSCMDLGHASFVNFLFLMGFTVLSEYLYEILIGISCVLLFTATFIWQYKCRNSLKYNDLKVKPSEPSANRSLKFLDMELRYVDNQLPILTDYRGHLLLATSICILAVDFDVFPRRFAKTKAYGWSVMDAGVGCFVAIHAMCSSQARGKVTSVKNSLLSSLPILLLGFIRLIAVTAVGYHTSISEYGVHWNFFFTLAITKVACTLLFRFFYFISSGFLAFSLAVFYQYLLSFGGVTEFILSEDRNNFVQKNKEGICSLIGFIVIYLMAVEVGKIFWKPRCKMKEWIMLLCLLLVIGFTGWVAMLILHHHVQPTSRRMANLSYSVWVIALSVLQIAMHLVEHILICLFKSLIQDGFKENIFVMQSSLLWKAINYNGLLHFLLANVLTGVVNMSMDTDKASVLQSMFVLFIYTYVLSITVILLMKFSFRIKFW